MTSYSSLIGGVQFDVTELAHIYAGAGGVLVVNRDLTLLAAQYIQGGLSFTIATPRTRRLRAQRQAKQEAEGAAVSP